MAFRFVSKDKDMDKIRYKRENFQNLDTRRNR